MGNEQGRADDLTTASSAVFNYLPASVQSLHASNSLYNKVMAENASAIAVNGWSTKDLLPVLTDCSNGTGLQRSQGRPSARRV